MRRVGAERIRQLALEAVEEAAAVALRAPVQRSRALAVALAWLLHFGRPSSPPPRWPFTHFWDALAVERDHDRQVSVTAAANAIYLALGEKRNHDQVAIFRDAQAAAEVARAAALAREQAGKRRAGMNEAARDRSA